MPQSLPSGGYRYHTREYFFQESGAQGPVAGQAQEYQKRALIAPDFTVSVYGSSCKDIFFGLVLAPFFFLSIYWRPKYGMGCQEIGIERKE